MKIGHRGAAGHAPENTLLSFQKAIDSGVDMIELDVYVCKTWELVVFHDKKLERTSNGHGYVAEKTFEELRSLDAGQGQYIPLLSEVLDLVARKVKINIELKGEWTAKPVADLIANSVQSKGWQYDDFLVSSSNHYALQEFFTYCPQVAIGAILSDVLIGFAEAGEKLHASSVHLDHEFISQAFVDDAHRRDMKVFVWTVDDPEEIESMKKLWVDGIFSNYPERL